MVSFYRSDWLSLASRFVLWTTDDLADVRESVRASAAQRTTQNDEARAVCPCQIHSRLLHQPVIQFLLPLPCPKVAFMARRVRVIDLSRWCWYCAEFVSMTRCLER